MAWPPPAYGVAEVIDGADSVAPRGDDVDRPTLTRTGPAGGPDIFPPRSTAPTPSCCCARCDSSAQARAGTGYDKTCFTINFDTRQVTCPQGQTNTCWSPAVQRGTEVIVVKFAGTTCRPRPARTQYTTAKRGGRQLTFYPRDLHHALMAARTRQASNSWQDNYKLRDGVEGTINQALDITGARHARYRGLPKVRLQHAFSATALNVIRLDAWWTTDPLRKPRTSRLEHLSYQLTG